MKKLLLFAGMPPKPARFLPDFQQIISGLSSATPTIPGRVITGEIVIEEDNQLVVLDFVFNGWGLKFAADKDNLITGKLSARGVFNTGYRHGGLVLKGAEFESDGLGTLLTTSECLLSPNRNPHLSKRGRGKTEGVVWSEAGFYGLTMVIWQATIQTRISTRLPGSVILKRLPM
jgi:hypothetical protein